MTDNDWLALAAALREEQCRLIHEGTTLEGETLTAVALRRAVARQGGLTPDHDRQVQESADRTARESLARQLRDCLAARRADQHTLAGRLAEELRSVNHPNAVPSRLRREGVEWAAQWLEGHKG